LRFREVISRLGEDRAILVSTHQTEDVAALCTSVVVLAGGRTILTGTPGELTAAARGRVWLGEARDAGAVIAWRTADGRQRQVGTPPPGVELAEPTLEDAYLLVLEDAACAPV